MSDMKFGVTKTDKHTEFIALYYSSDVKIDMYSNIKYSIIYITTFIYTLHDIIQKLRSKLNTFENVRFHS